MSYMWWCLIRTTTGTHCMYCIYLYVYTCTELFARAVIIIYMYITWYSESVIVFDQLAGSQYLPIHSITAGTAGQVHQRDTTAASRGVQGSNGLQLTLTPLLTSPPHTPLLPPLHTFTGHCGVIRYCVALSFPYYVMLHCTHVVRAP